MSFPLYCRVCGPCLLGWVVRIVFISNKRKGIVLAIYINLMIYLTTSILYIVCVVWCTRMRGANALGSNIIIVSVSGCVIFPLPLSVLYSDDI